MKDSPHGCRASRLQKWKPEWNFDLDDVSGTGGTLNVDSLANTRPIHQAAETPAQIQELFDGIAYGKAAAVLRMLESYLGEETFRAGVNAYLKQHQYANCNRRGLLGYPGEDFQEAGRQDHADLGEAGGRADHQCESAMLGQLHQRHGHATAVLLRPREVRSTERSTLADSSVPERIGAPAHGEVRADD